ncbi:MAG TPA: hypothetical protein VHB45_10565 [Alloacidobacterium sp.]|nr:hypothetical protein [Alloacidobacterium sp.]
MIKLLIREKRLLALVFCIALFLPSFAQEARSGAWRVATDAELKALIPQRAPVIQERIETELRTASGITDGKGKYVAGVVLITAGYSAEGKYSHFFLAQVPIKIGDIRLTAGEYLIGWKHNEDSLTVNFYEASTGRFLGSVEAVKNESITRVESFRIWPPEDKSVIQIGRFTFPYQLKN